MSRFFRFLRRNTISEDVKTRNKKGKIPMMVLANILVFLMVFAALALIALLIYFRFFALVRDKGGMVNEGITEEPSTVEGEQKMQYAIELYYDEKTEQKLFQLAERVANEGFSTKFLEWKTRPHLTLACFNDVDEDACKKKLSMFAESHKQMPAYIGSVGMFPDTKTIFVSPVMNSGMYQLQRELHECLNDFDTKGWEWYCPDRWVPHCTLALTGEDDEQAFFGASDLILHEFQKLSGMFAAVGLVKITFPVEEILTVKLA